MLIVFAGLPGVGKTTISRAVALRIAAVWLRVDAIEQAIRDAGVLPGGVGAAGYAAAQAIAEANLALGRMVVADCVNPVPESRAGWRAATARAGARIVEVEVVCSDPVEHRRRVETRLPDIAGLVLPTWEAVERHDYRAWSEPHLVLDGAGRRPEDLVLEVLEAIEAGSS